MELGGRHSAPPHGTNGSKRGVSAAWNITQTTREKLLRGTSHPEAVWSKQIEFESDQTSGSSYELTGNTEDRETC